MPRHPIGSLKKHRGKWTARVTFTRPGATQRTEWRRVARPNTKAIAGETLREKLRRLAAGIYSDEDAIAPLRSDAILFRDVAERYLTAHVSEPVYENGEKIRGMRDHRGVRSIVRNVLVPLIGNRPIIHIQHTELEELRNKRLDAPKRRGGLKVVEVKGKRSIARVNREMATLRAIFNYAIDSGVIDRNPMKGQRGKSLVRIAAERGRERVLSHEEEKKLLAAIAADEKLRRILEFVVAALDTGMRRSELLQLEERDVDLEASVLRLRWEATKTKRTRTIPLSARVKAIVSRRLSGHATARIFFDLSETIVRNDFAAARSKIGLTDFQLRDCRATLATRLLQAGISEAEIALVTGHRFRVNGNDQGSPILRKHYLRLTPETLSRATAAIDGTQIN